MTEIGTADAPRRILSRRWWPRIAGVIGLFASGIAIWQFFYEPPKPEATRFVPTDSPDERPRLLSENVGDTFVIAPTVIVTGSTTVPPGFTLVANEVEFDGDGVLVGDRILIAAVRVSGGKLDVSGADGINASSPGEAGGDGGDAGEITLIAARAPGLSIDARGGDGGDGARGAAGRDGRNGRCDGFGRWRPAQSGGNGGDGGAAGSGGAGGDVFIFGPVSETVTGAFEGGRRGEAGDGGPGGRGGRGCTGLGGSQSSKPNGHPGARGANADDGDAGTQSPRPIVIQKFASGLRELIESNRADYDSVKDLALSIESPRP